MPVETIDHIQSQIMTILTQLPPEKKTAVLNFAVSLQQQEIMTKWANISDDEAAKIKAEFEEEDLNFSESVISDYLTIIQL